MFYNTFKLSNFIHIYWLPMSQICWEYVMKHIWSLIKRACYIVNLINKYVSFCSFGAFLGSDGKGFAPNEGDLGLISGSGRSPREENDYPFQYSCLENSMDRGTWLATVHGVAKSQTFNVRATNILFFWISLKLQEAHSIIYGCLFSSSSLLLA